MKTETIEEFLKRGGKITRYRLGYVPNISPAMIMRMWGDPPGKKWKTVQNQGKRKAS